MSLSFGVITEVKLKVKKEVKKGLGVLLAVAFQSIKLKFPLLLRHRHGSSRKAKRKTMDHRLWHFLAALLFLLKTSRPEWCLMSIRKLKMYQTSRAFTSALNFIKG